MVADAAESQADIESGAVTPAPSQAALLPLPAAAERHETSIEVLVRWAHAGEFLLWWAPPSGVEVHWLKRHHGISTWLGSEELPNLIALSRDVLDRQLLVDGLVRVLAVDPHEPLGRDGTEEYRLVAPRAVLFSSLLVDPEAVAVVCSTFGSMSTAVARAAAARASMNTASAASAAVAPLHQLLGVSRRDAERITLLGPDALLSLDRLAGLIPREDTAVKNAAREAGIIRRVAGKEMVRYGDFLDAHPPSKQPSAAPKRRQQKSSRPPRSGEKASMPRVKSISASDW